MLDTYLPLLFDILESMHAKRQEIIDELKLAYPHLNIFADKYSPNIICIDESNQQEMVLTFRERFTIHNAHNLLVGSKLAPAH